MALDIGERRIGVAISESGLLATPHSIIHRKTKQVDFARLQQLVSELSIERVIVGLPYPLNNPEQLGPQARRIKRYAAKLAQILPIPLEYFDESYSTVEAKAYLGQTSAKRTHVDDAAAAVILQKYLDRGPERVEK
jgi:putative Holliday junction resolvase